MRGQGCGGSASDPSAPVFSSARAGELLVSACREVGLEPAGARLLRFGENASYRLAGTGDRVVVRISRSPERPGRGRPGPAWYSRR